MDEPHDHMYLHKGEWGGVDQTPLATQALEFRHVVVGRRCRWIERRGVKSLRDGGKAPLDVTVEVVAEDGVDDLPHQRPASVAHCCVPPRAQCLACRRGHERQRGQILQRLMQPRHNREEALRVPPHTVPVVRVLRRQCVVVRPWDLRGVLVAQEGEDLCWVD